jgi:hypothetical protein
MISRKFSAAKRRAIMDQRALLPASLESVGPVSFSVGLFRRRVDDSGEARFS